MAEALSLPLGRPLAAFTALPMQRQFGLLLGAAMVIALAVSLAVWGLRPTYQPLLPGMAERDVVQAMNVLSRLGIEHKLDPVTGSLTVPAVNMHEARLHLATEGIPRAEGVGFELLDQQSGIGSSRLVEAARFQRALEGELARSVMTLDSVASARVHLALPRDSVFIRDRVKPGASVLINLHPARTLDDKQVAGVIHMVASSVPELTPERVTVIDQRGRLLSSPEDDTESGLPSRQLEYTREVEDALRRRVEDILMPLLGPNGMRVQVTAAVDFTRVESTREVYDPEGSVLRSEQISEEQRSGLTAGGIPGALTNQPPDGATLAPPASVGLPGGGADAAAGETQTAVAAAPSNRSRSSTRNFELDRTISHIRAASANLERLSVAVVVDHLQTVDESGEPVRVPRGEDEMNYLRALVEEAVGFDSERGDRLNVVNASFREIEQPEALPALPLWQEPWALDLIKQAGSGLGILLLLLLVLRPALKTLAHAPARPLMPAALAAPDGTGAPAAAGVQTVQTVQAVPATLEGSLEQARQLTREDPRLIAQVVRQWVSSDEK